MKIYLASSWRNQYQPAVIGALRDMGYEVYDFRNPKLGDVGFAWSEIDEDWIDWTPQAFVDGLASPIADAGFASDWDAMQWADTFVLLLPSGRSAHLEAGWAIGQGKPTFILVPEPCEPELMYKMATGIALSVGHLTAMLDGDTASV